MDNAQQILILTARRQEHVDAVNKLQIDIAQRQSEIQTRTGLIANCDGALGILNEQESEKKVPALAVVPDEAATA